MLPNFIVVGAMKAGTTSYSAMLYNHPDIYMPANEVHFFDVDSRYQRGLAEYETDFTGWDGETAIGEKTPTYSYREDVPGRIAEHLPDVKLIWLFREPVARAYSHYRFFISRGSERLTFDRAIQRERRGATPHYTMNYIDRSLYAVQVERFLKYFPREQMRFFLFERLLNDPWEVMRESCEFLGVDTSYDFGTEIPRENVTALPRSVFLQWFGRQTVKPVSSRLWRIWREMNRHRGKYPSLPDGLKAELAAYFAPHNQRLSELTGLDVSIWQQQTQEELEDERD